MQPGIYISKLHLNTAWIKTCKLDLKNKFHTNFKAISTYGETLFLGMMLINMSSRIYGAIPHMTYRFNFRSEVFS